MSFPEEDIIHPIVEDTAEENQEVEEVADDGQTYSESDSDGQDAEGAESEVSEDAQEEGESEEEVSPSLYTVKVDGADKEVPLEELLRGYAHGSAANKRFEEAAAIRKENEAAIGEYETFFGQLQESPLQTLAKIPALQEVLQQEIGQYLRKVQEREQMSEEELRISDKEAELAEKERQFQEWEAKRKSEDQSRTMAQVREQLSTWVGGALEDFTTNHERKLFKMNMQTLAQRQHSAGKVITEEHVKEAAKETRTFLESLSPKKAVPTKVPAPGGRSGNRSSAPVKKKKGPAIMEDFFASLREEGGIL